MEEDRYNIENYTDNELYDLLDLTNPTDRVLEAKIIAMINKYSTNATEEGLKLTNFFYEIYNHFFESIKQETEFFDGHDEEHDEEHDEDQEEANKEERKREGFDTAQQTLAGIKSQVAQQTQAPQQTNSSVLQSTSGEQGVQSILKVNQLDYTKDKLNPLLKQTIKRVISIDSQFRNINPELKITTPSTNFTFNLSEPLKDVVSLSLYSVQIPYTWYTINKNYGGNFFYIKGNSAGINIDQSFSYKIEIAPGNYKPDELVTEINKSIVDISNSNPDINFGGTIVGYNSYTNNASITVDLKNIFNERNYQLQFKDWSYPLILNDPTNISVLADNNQQRYLQTTNIGAYLGFNRPNYNINSIYSINNGAYSPRFNELGLSSTDNLSVSNYRLDSSNNYFTIIQYYNKKPTTDLYYVENNTNKTTILKEITISLSSLSTGYQGRQVIVDEINKQLNENGFLIDSSLARIDVTDASDNQNFQHSYYQLTINLNRKTTQNFPNAKTVVVFPDESYITTGTKLWVYDPDVLFTNCCFNFPSRYNELGDITAESYSLQSSYLANYTTNPYIEFICNSPGYTYDISVNVYNPASFPISSLGISLDTLITNITYNLNYHTTTMGNIFTNNTSLIDSNLNSKLSFILDFNIPFDNSYFLIDFSGNSIDDFFRNFNENGVKKDVGLSNMLSGNGNIISSGNVTINGNATITGGNITINGIVSIEGNVTISGNVITPIGNAKVNGIIITGNTTINAISNAINLSINGNLLINTNTSTNITGNIIVFGNNKITGNTTITGSATTTTGISKTFTFTQEASSTYSINNNLFTIHPTDNDIIGNTTSWNVAPTPELNQPNSINIFVDYVNTCLKSFFDISYNHKDGSNNIYSTTYSYPLSSSSFSYKYNTTIDTGKLYIDFSLTIVINKTLTQNDYDMYLREGNGGNLWSSDLYFESSYNLNNYYVNGTTYSQITNNRAVGAYTCTLSKDTTINLKGITNGVYSSGGENDIIIDISAGKYTRTELFTTINKGLTNNPLTNGSVINTKTINGIEFIYFHFNINKIFNASDYRIVFYDIYSFVNCYEGYTKQPNSTWDSTLGWILGFREKTEYYLTNSTQTITGDTAVSTNIYNYFLIVLDDYTQSHLNDGLVTITKREGSIPLPSYTNRTLLECDNNGQNFFSGSIYDNPGNNLTQKQVYAANQVLLSKNTVNTVNYSSGPFMQDIFGIVPVKVGGIPNGGYYVEFGGTLQNQQRLYFGPVNISRITIKLIDDRGNLVDLNNANWSFSFICEQLYQQTSV